MMRESTTQPISLAILIPDDIKTLIAIFMVMNILNMIVIHPSRLVESFHDISTLEFLSCGRL